MVDLELEKEEKGRVETEVREEAVIDALSVVVVVVVVILEENLRKAEKLMEYWMKN